MCTSSSYHYKTCIHLVYLCRCNQVGFYQEGPPTGQPAIVTRLVQPAYDEVSDITARSYVNLNLRLSPRVQRQCTYYFPGAFTNSTPAPNVNAVNSAYDGWNVNIDRLFFANGQSKLPQLFYIQNLCCAPKVYQGAWSVFHHHSIRYLVSRYETLANVAYFHSCRRSLA